MKSGKIREAFNRLARKVAVGGFAAAMMLPGAASAASLMTSANVPPPEVTQVALPSPELSSRTQASHHIRTLQERFRHAAGDTDVIVIDRDWFQLNFAANARDSGIDPQQLRLRLLSDYIFRQSGRRMTPQQLDSIAEDVLTGSGEAYVMPYSQRADGAAGRSCIAFGARTEMSAEGQARAMLALHPLIHGQEIGTARLRAPMPLDVMNRMTDYHEIGHCMDKWYIGAANRADKAADAFAYDLLHHEAETYADVFALMMMARDGYADIAALAEWRANMRLAALALTGPIRTQVTSASDPGHEGGYIYAIHGAIRAAAAKIGEIGPQRLREMSLDQIRDLCHDITERSALKDPAQEEAITYMLAHDFNLAVWDRLRAYLPHIEERYRIALHFKAEMNAALRAVLELDDIAPGADIVAAIPFNPRGLYLLPGVSDALARQNTQEMTERLAGAATDRAGLFRAFTTLKDELRAKLATGSAAEQKDAARRLEAMPAALILALREIEPPAIASAAPPKGPQYRA